MTGRRMVVFRSPSGREQAGWIYSIRGDTVSISCGGDLFHLSSDSILRGFDR